MVSEPTTAAHVVIAVIPIVGIVMGSTIIFFYLLWQHREKIKMIERGIRPSAVFDLEVFSLLTGLLAGILGILLTVFFIASPAGPFAVLGGLIPLGVGVALLTFFMIRRKANRE
ncbi:MAG: hypothetical protein EA426_05415 [Spirochaetaceae bacterium]|nr:MAG: hypothetical protein EA426_05415 [Spirochaetaceae bacterium]